MPLPHLILTAGILQLGLLLASARVPSVLNWKAELAKLQPLTRQLIWVHGAFIVLTIISLGVISIAFPTHLADGSPVSRAFCAFAGLFWLARLFVQFFIFDAKPFLTTRTLALGYHAMTLVFICLALIFLLAAIAPKVLP